MCKNGPPPGGSNDIRISSQTKGGGFVYSKAAISPSTELLEAKVTDIWKEKRAECIAGTYTLRQILDDLDEHFSCNVRELGLKASIKEKLTQLNKSQMGAAPMESDAR